MREFGPKIILSVCIGLLILLSVFKPRMSQPGRADATEISVSFWGAYEEWTMWRDIAEAFMAKNPDISVRLAYIPGNYDDKIRLLLSANDAPDIMMIQDEPFHVYARYGKFADLTELAYAPDSPVDWDKDFWSTAPPSFTYKGRVLGVPMFGGNVLIYYNRKMFRELGVPYPSDDWTFDDFLATARALSQDTNGDGKQDTFGINLPHWIYMLPFTWGFGADYLSPDKTQWTFTGPEALAATEFYKGLRWNKDERGFAVAPSAQDAPNPELEGAMFMTGRLGMTVGGPWSGLAHITAGVDMDVAPVPIGPVGERFSRVTWDGLCMFDRSKHKAEAWRFLLFCVSEEGQAIAARSGRAVPALMAAADSFRKPDNGWSEEKFIDALEYSRLQPITYKWEKMRQIMDQRYEQLNMNRSTPQETIDRMADDIRRNGVFPIEADE